MNIFGHRAPDEAVFLLFGWRKAFIRALGPKQGSLGERRE